MTDITCPHCKKITGIEKTWIKREIGTFTRCNHCGKRVVLGPVPVANGKDAMDETGLDETRKHVEHPRRVSALEMRRRLDGRINKVRDG